MMNRNTILNTILNDNQIALFYLGQEGFLIKHRNLYILIDPYLSDYVDKHCSTETLKWIRNYPAPIAASELDFIDYVLCTHAHYDHADPYTLSTLALCNSKAKFIAPIPMNETLLSYGISQDRIIGAMADEMLELDGCNITPIPSAHEELHKDENGNYMELGYKIHIGQTSIYHAGDCCIYDGLVERLLDVSVLMVPINGRSYFKRYEQDIIGNMTIEEAVILAQKTKPSLLIPMHYDLYSVNCVNPAHFVDTLCSLNATQKFHMFVPGERYIFQI